MPAKKAARQSIKRYHRNRSVRSATRTAVTKLLHSVESGDVAVAEPDLVDAVKALDIAVQKGVIHKNSASRRKSRLYARFNRLSRVGSV